ncbi:DUF4240 domain-containing protein [Streptomyces sp. NBC_01288]|uniref:DUF4240 domain-containing protein n=1 Tax=Streptomyces sp. NBC_01288 TaxID=2903814 RepID=UPI002E0EC2E7|nr:DUF4240 domain-containing protein [Streptomyces sp. NBC_01288]
MDDETFWNLIEGCRRRTPDPDERVVWLAGRLARGAEPEIVRFQICLGRVLSPTYTWELWAAADRIMGWCSDDSFFYFRLWLVGLGRDAFERVTRDPDALAELPEVVRLVGREREAWDEEEWLAWEELDYAALRAFTQVTGRSEVDFYDAVDAQRGEDSEPLDPAGERWDANDDERAKRRLPRLSALFPVAEGNSGTAA